MPASAFELDRLHVEQEDGQHVEEEVGSQGLLAGRLGHLHEIERVVGRGEASELGEDPGLLFEVGV